MNSLPPVACQNKLILSRFQEGKDGLCAITLSIRRNNFLSHRQTYIRKHRKTMEKVFRQTTRRKPWKLSGKCETIEIVTQSENFYLFADYKVNILSGLKD